MLFEIKATSPKYFYEVSHINFDECGTFRPYITRHEPPEIEDHFNSEFIEREIKAGTVRKVNTSHLFFYGAASEKEAINKSKEVYPDCEIEILKVTK